MWYSGCKCIVGAVQWRSSLLSFKEKTGSSVVFHHTLFIMPLTPTESVLGCPSATFNLSFVCPFIWIDLVTAISREWLEQFQSNLQRVFTSPAPTDECWRSKVKVTTGRWGGEGIDVDPGSSMSIFQCPYGSVSVKCGCLFVRSLSSEWSVHGLRFNCIAPGPIYTKVTLTNECCGHWPWHVTLTFNPRRAVVMTHTHTHTNSFERQSVTKQSGNKRMDGCYRVVYCYLHSECAVGENIKIN